MDTCCQVVDLFAAFDHVLDVYALSNLLDLITNLCEL